MRAAVSSLERPPGAARALLAPVALGLLALAVRLLHLYTMRDSPFFLYPILDSRIHDEWAWALASGGETPWKAPFFRAPLYPCTVAGIYSVFGHSLMAVRVFQAVLGSLSVVLVHLIGRRLFGTRVAWIGGLTAALYWMFPYFEGEILIATLIIFLDLAALLALLEGLRRPRAGMFLLAGLLIGLSAIARPNILLFAPVAAGWVLVAFRKELPRSLATRLAPLTIGVLLPILPVTIANVRAGDFVLIASQGGVNFYIGNNPESDGVRAVVPGTRTDWWGGYQDTILIAEQAAGHPLRPSEVSAFWYERGREFLRSHPGAALRLMLRKLYLFWNHVEMGNDQDIYFVEERAPVLKLLAPVGFGLVAPLALVGLVIAWREVRRSRLLALFVASYMVSVVLFFVNARYRMPVVPVLILFAALAADRLVTEALARRTRRFLVVAVPTVLCAVLVHSNLHGFERSNPALAHYHLGLTYRQAGALEKAEAEFREALRLEPERRDARYHLAVILLHSGRAEEAERVLGELLDRFPEDAETHYVLGNARAESGDLAAAETELREAVRLRPYYYEAHHSLGVVLYRQERLEEAAGEFRKAVEIHPRFAAAWNNLGIILAREGDERAARRMFEEVLRIDPTHAGARENLARLGAGAPARPDSSGTR